MDSLNDLVELRNPEYQVIIIIDAENGRLNPMTMNTPRCLLPVANRRILSYQIDLLIKCGVYGKLIIFRAFRAEYEPYGVSRDINRGS